MRYLSVLALIFSSFVCDYSYAQLEDDNTDGVTSFKQDNSSWRRKEEDDIRILQTIQDSVGDAGIRNITDAEQIYCYNVDTAPASYEGYTIDNMAVKAFCGSLDAELKSVIIGSLFSNPENVSTKLEQCVIRPKLMFRFVRGIDYTDVLLSSPCYSFTIFYGGKFKSYNFSKGSDTIDELVSIFSDEQNIVPFVSPALLDQIVPVGIAQTEDQKNKVKQSKASGPIKKWEEDKPKEEAPKAGGGWNNLNI